MEIGIIIFGIAVIGLLIPRIILNLVRIETNKKQLQMFERDEALKNPPDTLGAENAEIGLLRYQKYALIDKIHTQRIEKICLIVAISISVIVLLVALYVILSESQSNESQKWAFGAVGTIIGYWLKP